MEGKCALTVRRISSLKSFGFKLKNLNDTLRCKESVDQFI